MKGKIIYTPSGKAREYSEYAANFYNGCSNACDYCYCRKGLLSRLWSDTPTLKAGLRDNAHAMEVFRHELDRHVEELRKSTLFFSFTTDPMLPATRDLTIEAALCALSQGVNVSILTKCADMQPLIDRVPVLQRRHVAIGFTLTGCDHLEPSAATNKERMQAMRQMYILGYRTWASIEPVIDIQASVRAITLTSDFCELYKVGLLIGKKPYSGQEVKEMYRFLHTFRDCRFYLKESFLSFIGLERTAIGSDLFVGGDYNLFLQPTAKESVTANPALVCYYNILFVDDIACSMTLEAVAEVKRYPSLYRQLVKKRTNELDDIRRSCERRILSVTNRKSFFYGDCAQNMLDAIGDEVSELEDALMKRLDGAVSPARLFVRMELARAFAGMACVSYDARQEDLTGCGQKRMRGLFRLTDLLDAINLLYDLLLKQCRFDGVIELNTEETSAIVDRISQKLCSLEIMQKCVYDSEIQNLTEIE